MEFDFVGLTLTNKTEQDKSELLNMNKFDSVIELSYQDVSNVNLSFLEYHDVMNLLPFNAISE